MSLINVETIVPAFRTARVVNFKEGTGQGYGSFIPYFSIQDDFPLDQTNLPSWNLKTNAEGIMCPYTYLALYGDNSCYVLLYLPIKDMMDAINNGRLLVPGVAGGNRMGSAYSTCLAANVEAGMAEIRPRMGYGGTPLNGTTLRSDAAVSYPSKTFSLSQLNSILHNNYRNICDNFKGIVNENENPEIFTLLRDIYYSSLSRFLNASNTNTYSPANNNALPSPFSIPIDLIRKAMIVVFRQNYVYSSQAGGCCAEMFCIGGSGYPMTLRSTNPHDKQIWILGPNFPKYITFQAGGTYSTSSENFSNPPIYINTDGEELKLPTGRYFAGQTKYSIEAKYESSIKSKNPEYIRSLGYSKITGTKEFTSPIIIPEAKNKNEAPNLGQIDTLVQDGVKQGIQKYIGIFEPDWNTYNFSFYIYGNGKYPISQVYFVTNKNLDDINNLTIKDILVPICFNIGSASSNSNKTGLSSSGTHLNWGMVIYVTWDKFQELLPEITEELYYEESMILDKNPYLKEFSETFSQDSEYVFEDVKKWCEEKLKDCIIGIGYSTVGAYSDVDVTNWGHSMLLYSNPRTSYLHAGGGFLGKASQYYSCSACVNLKRIGNPSFNIYDITYNTNAKSYDESNIETLNPSRFEGVYWPNLNSASYYKESDPATLIRPFATKEYYLKSSSNKINSVILGDKLLKEGTLLLPKKEGTKESIVAYTEKPNVFNEINKFNKNIILENTPTDAKHLVNKEYVDNNYYDHSSLSNFEERWNNTSTLIENNENFSNPLAVLFKFSTTVSSSAPFNNFCGLSNIQFLNEDGTPWYLVAVSNIQASGTTWNKAWISKTKPSNSDWNYDWSNVRSIAASPSAEDQEFLESFPDILEIKCRQSSAPSNSSTWGFATQALQCKIQYVSDQYKIGVLNDTGTSGTFEYYFDEAQVVKPCFKDIKAIRGIQGAFSNGSAAHNGTSWPTYAYLSYQFKIERFITLKNGAQANDMLFERPAYVSASAQKCMFQVPFVPSVGYSFIKYKIPEGSPTDLATSINAQFDDYNPMIYRSNDIQYPLPLNLINQNENGKFYFTQQEYDNLTEEQKLNNKLYLIIG